MTSREAPLLDIRKLSVRYHGRVRGLDGVGFELRAGEAAGVLGESGCGKTTLALAVLGLLPPEGEIVAGSIRFRGRRLDRLGEEALEKIRGAEISLIFQDPTLALHPMRRVGEQVDEVLRAHRSWPRPRRRRETARRLAEVGLGDAGDAYPHQLSGGQRQRVVIAQALACRPALVIADEPTASLDTTTERGVLELLSDLRRRVATSILYISHDPRVLARVADRLLVMYGGKLVEDGPTAGVLDRPRHPYTEALLECRPQVPGESRRPPQTRLPVIPGGIEEMPASGCRFALRCAYREARCAEQDPGAFEIDGRRVWCWRYE